MHCFMEMTTTTNVNNFSLCYFNKLCLAAEKVEAPKTVAIEINGTTKEKVVDSIGCDVKNPKEIAPTYFLLIARENGNFYIHSLPDLELVYRVKKLTDLPEILINTPITSNELEESLADINSSQHQDFFAKQSNVGVKPEDTIMEIQLNGLGYNNTRPVLSIFVDDVVWFYEMFICNDGYRGMKVNVGF